jgi:hypothetical protein
MNKKLQYVAALGIMVVIGVYYWYSRNIVTGYYEILWFRNYTGEGDLGYFLFPLPILAFIGYGIYRLVKYIKNKKLEVQNESEVQTGKFEGKDLV